MLKNVASLKEQLGFRIWISELDWAPSSYSICRVGWGRLAQGEEVCVEGQSKQSHVLCGPPVLTKGRRRNQAGKSFQVTNPGTGEWGRPGVDVTRASSTFKETEWMRVLPPPPTTTNTPKQVSSGWPRWAFGFPFHHWGFLSFPSSLIPSAHSSLPFLLPLNPVHTVEWDHDDMIMMFLSYLLV